jgi:hypothetical protein
LNAQSLLQRLDGLAAAVHDHGRFGHAPDGLRHAHDEGRIIQLIATDFEYFDHNTLDLEGTLHGNVDWPDAIPVVVCFPKTQTAIEPDRRFIIDESYKGDTEFARRV